MISDGENENFEEENFTIKTETTSSPDVLPASPNPSNPGLADLKCILETRELWNKFHELGTEMIITKSGRYRFEQK